MKKILILTIIFSLLLFSGCTFPPAVTISTVNRMGRVLEEGKKEIGIITFLHIPAKLSFSYGLKRNWELQGNLGSTSGLSAFDIYHLELNFIKEILKKEKFFVNTFLGGDIWLNPDNNFLGYNFSGGISLGYYPLSRLGFYVPITINVITHNYQGDYVTNTIFIPGVGMVFELEKFSFKIGGNFPSYLDLGFFFKNLYAFFSNQPIETVSIGGVVVQPNLSAEFSYKW